MGEPPVPAHLVEHLQAHPGLVSGSQNLPDFSLVREFLSGGAADWFSLSIPLPRDRVDPFFVEVARQSGSQAFFGGGSDLIDLGLLRGPKIASPGEVNIIRPRSIYERQAILEEWTFHDFSVPAWEGRPRLDGANVGINGESGRDLQIMVANHAAGNWLITGQPFINVPFKHGHIVRVGSDGEARLYFRTEADFHNYRNKRLSFPDETRIPADWHTAVLARQTGAILLRNTVFYSLIVYARTHAEGWRYTDISQRVLRTWVEALGQAAPAERATLIADLRLRAPLQGVSPTTLAIVLGEFGLGP